MWLYLILNLVKTSQRNDPEQFTPGAMSFAELLLSIACHRPASVEKFTTIHAAQFPITCPWRL